MIEIGEIQDLEIDTFDAEVSIGLDLFGYLIRGPSKSACSKL